MPEALSTLLLAFLGLLCIQLPTDKASIRQLSLRSPNFPQKERIDEIAGQSGAEKKDSERVDVVSVRFRPPIPKDTVAYLHPKDAPDGSTYPRSICQPDAMRQIWRSGKHQGSRKGLLQEG